MISDETTAKLAEHVVYPNFERIAEMIYSAVDVAQDPETFLMPIFARFFIENSQIEADYSNRTVILSANLDILCESRTDT